MELQGFCLLKSGADCKHAMGNPKNWQGKMLMAMEINDSTESVLLLQGSEMGMFDAEDVHSSFKCIRKGHVLIPHNLNEFDQMIYFAHVMGRNGGSNETTMKMVIAASLHYGEFNDNILWAKDQDPAVVQAVKLLKEKSKN